MNQPQARIDFFAPFVSFLGISTLIFLCTLIQQAACFASPDLTPELSKSIETIRSVGPEGKGNAAAGAAWRDLIKSGPVSILPLLRAMDGANDYSLNWFHAGIDSLAEEVWSKNGTLPIFELSKFLTEANHHSRARRLAYELIQRQDPVTAAKMLPTLLNDSSMENRRDAVDWFVTEARASQASSNLAGASVLLQQALAASRVPDQIDEISKGLEGLGQRVDPRGVFCFVTNWHVIGPFNNTSNTGYAAIFPPEQKIELAAEYDGLTNRVRWQAYSTTNQYGLVDMNQNYGKLKSVVAYAVADFVSDRAQPVELRLGGKNSWKVWLNGNYLFGRDEYHLNEEIDQYRMPAQLETGHNTILVKVCQNAQTEDWAEEWEFQLRVTDPLGTPIVPADNAAASPRPPGRRAARD
jgi:hypothetical protein